MSDPTPDLENLVIREARLDDLPVLI